MWKGEQYSTKYMVNLQSEELRTGIVIICFRSLYLRDKTDYKTSVHVVFFIIHIVNHSTRKYIYYQKINKQNSKHTQTNK